MKNLEKFGVQELGTQEMKKADGGAFWWVLGFLATGIAYDVISDPEGAWEAFKDGANSNF